MPTEKNIQQTVPQYKQSSYQIVEFPSFADRLVQWQLAHGRHSLPWQGTRDPYVIWISEVMLQQTQVNTVIPYFERFMATFPNVAALAAASVEAVLALWSGLGYYSRGRNLHRTACILQTQYDGKFPKDAASLQQLPGIGRSTAAAIAVFAVGERVAILDGNVKRILARYFGIGTYPSEKKTEQHLWELAEDLLPSTQDHQVLTAYTQGLMDLGALVCTRAQPHCQRCPLQVDCKAYRDNLTATLPAAKPKKILPTKEVAHLILLNQGHVLLTKRPTSGIWGGLWCFPEVTVDQNGIDYCAENLCLQVERQTELAPLNHTFTHFKLTIYPQILRLISHQSSWKKSDRENNYLWVGIEEALTCAIPAPVRKLLLAVQPLLRTFMHE